MPGRTYTLEELQNPRQPVVLVGDQFLSMFQTAYNQGEHVAIVGPTGSGKTLLGLCLCKAVGARRAKDGAPSRVTVIQTKPRDDTLRLVLPEKEWPKIKKWPPGYGQEHCVVWPPAGVPSSRAARQRAVLLPLLDTLEVEGNQTVYIPEAAYFERPLPKGMGMSATMEQLWAEARSNRLGVISDTQRPRMVTRLMWSEPQWLVVFMPEDEDDLRRVAEMSGFKRDVWNIVPNLGEHEFLCIRRQRHKGKRELYVSRIDAV
jgi:energy-coupling factor transporter ATP-binding protein EcfA2